MQTHIAPIPGAEPTVAISVLIPIVAWLVAGLSGAGLDPLAVLAIAVALFVLVGWGPGGLMIMRRRLKDASKDR